MKNISPGAYFRNFTVCCGSMGLRYYHKYLHIDRLFKRAFKLRYCKELFLIENIIALKDKKLTRLEICDLNIVIVYGYFSVLRKPEVDEVIGFYTQRQCYFHQ